MATLKFDLEDGIKVGDDVLTHVVLRELTAGDIIEAGQESEIVVKTADGPTAVSSPALMGALTLCRQIKRVGMGEQKINGPLELVDLKKFTAADLEGLQEHAARLEEAVIAVKAGENPSEKTQALIDNGSLDVSRELARRGRAADDGGNV